jgi:hypothetical protein
MFILIEIWYFGPVFLPDHIRGVPLSWILKFNYGIDILFYQFFGFFTGSRIYLLNTVERKVLSYSETYHFTNHTESTTEIY